MAPPRTLFRLLGVLIIALAFSPVFSSPATAQDRSVPRFGTLVDADTVKALPSDFGRMWSFAQPPLDYFEEQYGVRADQRGLRHARQGMVRLPGCSGSLVSARGLVLTAARCVREALPEGQSDSVRNAAFYAESSTQEQSLPGLYADRLVQIEDVTGRVDSAGMNGREAVQAQIQEAAPDDHVVEVVSEAGGARVVAYTYRRIEDVRLVFLPDRTVSLLGRLGEPLAYPQHAWDVAALRLYDGDEFLQTPQHLEVGEQGARPGDPVFAVTHLAETRRAETHQQLAFRRDVQLPAQTAVLDRWTAHLQRYVDTSSSVGVWADRLAADQVARRQSQARLESLQSDYLMARLKNRDQQLRRTMATDTPSKTNDTLIDRLGALQSEKRALSESYRTFSFLLNPNYTSVTFRRALRVHRAQTDSVSSQAFDTPLQGIPDLPTPLDAALLKTHIQHLRQHLAADSSLMRTFENMGSAASLVRESVFSNPDQVRARMQENRIPEDDPMLTLVAAVDERFSAFETTWTKLVTREKQLTDSLSRVRHRVADLPVTLPQQQTLRMADGRVKGYPYNGTLAPSFTTFYGLYGRHYDLHPSDGGDLPAFWQNPPASFERSTPLTTVASTDLGRGAYGGPLLNTSLQVVGLVFDGNIQSAAGQYLYLPRRMRTVAVDVRGVIEGLTAIYEADDLVQEMTGESSSQ